MSQVTVRLNGKPRAVQDGVTLLQLLSQLDVQPGRVVIEHNREIRRLEDFELFWDIGKGTADPVLDPTRHAFESASQFLEHSSSGGWCNDRAVCDAVNGAIRVLGELLRGFNENIYRWTPDAKKLGRGKTPGRD